MLLCVTLATISISPRMCYSQVYKNVVFEGGAIQGIAHFGAIQILDSAGLLKDIEYCTGSSSGAIAAMMLSVGYTPSEMEYIAFSMKWEELNDGAYALMSGSIRLLQHYGWLEGAHLRYWIEELLRRKTAIQNITFRQLDSLRKIRPGYKRLKVASTHLNKLSSVEFSFETSPDMVVSDAVYASSAIPLYFQPLVTDSAGHKLPQHFVGTGSEQYYADGALLANVPYFLVEKLPGKSIGILLEVPENVSQADSTGNNVRINNFIDYSEACYYAVIENQNESLPDEWLKNHAVHIKLSYSTPRIRKMKKEEIEELLQNGRVAARDFIKQR